MRPPKSSSLLLILAMSLCSFSPTTTNASSPTDDTGQRVKALQQENTTTSLSNLVDVQLTALPAHTLHLVADSGFNPRTDFPTQTSNVITAGYGTFNLQECCGGGTWNYANQPADRTLPLLGAVLFAAMLLAAVVHRYEKRRQQHLAFR